MLEDKKYMEECVEKNLAFLKSIPNSVQYWMDRKKDLFAMMRQLGKPTMFLTMSANEIRWPKLIKTLHRLNNCFKDVQVNAPLEDLNRSQCSHLVNEDPVTCCIYFNKLVDVIMRMLQSKYKYNPFGKYRVVDYFLRIEFQHRGSPHAHILVWLDNDPREKVSENRPKTLQLITDLCSVNADDVKPEIYANQVHRHTFACTKCGETSCRFDIPYWPMDRSRVLIPMPNDDNRRDPLRAKAKKVREALGRHRVLSIAHTLTPLLCIHQDWLNK
jgi:hypothetical protein